MYSLSVAANVIAMIKPSASITIVYHEYYMEVKKATISAQKILPGVLEYPGILKQLRDLASSFLNASKKLVTLRLYLRANSLLGRCEAELKRLFLQLDPSASSRGGGRIHFLRIKVRKMK